MPEDTDTGTDAAAPAEITTTELLDALGETQLLVIRQQEAMEVLEEKLATLEKKHTKANRLPADFERDGPAVPRKVADGTVRFVHQFTEALMIKQQGKRILVDGSTVYVPQVGADFNGGIYETTDPEMITWLREHPSYGTELWEDEWAQRRSSVIDVVEGVRTTVKNPKTGEPRAPLSAPMGS